MLFALCWFGFLVACCLCLWAVAVILFYGLLWCVSCLLGYLLVFILALVLWDLLRYCFVFIVLFGLDFVNLLRENCYVVLVLFV